MTFTPLAGNLPLVADPLTTHARLLQEARRELEKARREVARWEKLVAAFEGDVAAEESYLLGESLASIEENGTIGTAQMEAVLSRGAAIAAAKTKNPTKFQKALAARGKSIPEWAREQRNPSVEAETARSWVKRGAGGRPCPRAWADRIAKELVDKRGRSEVPAVAASWPHGIRE